MVYFGSVFFFMKMISEGLGMLVGEVGEVVYFVLVGLI